MIVVRENNATMWLLIEAHQSASLLIMSPTPKRCSQHRNAISSRGPNVLSSASLEPMPYDVGVGREGEGC